MTASSVDFFPCRVKLMGLPPASISITAANNSTRPSIANIHSISRNLFGTPDPSEMKTLYQREAERVRSYVLHRYNFDTNAIKTAADQEGKRLPTDEIHTSKTTMIPEMQPTQLPPLIEEELRQHEQNLKNEKDRLGASFLDSTQIDEHSFLKVARMCNKSTNLISPVVDHQNRFSRQPLLKASSVDFFPCRVKLMGLPPASISITAANNSTRPSIANIHSISRNLFGTPDPSEMKTLYQREAERVRSYVLHRYNFDTNAIKTAADQEGKRLPTDEIHTSKTTMIPEMQPTQLPPLIEEELRQHEQNLKNEKDRLGASFLDSTQIDEHSFLKVARMCNKSTNLISPVVDHQNRFSRQPLLKESFKIRKNRVCKRNNGQYCNNDTIRLESSQNAHRNLEILKLSQPLNFQQRKCDTQDKGNEMSIHNNFICTQNTDIKEHQDKTISYDEKCTTFSLQLVVSTQNVS